jgi:hypothetical protein
VSNDATDYIRVNPSISTILIDPITSYRFNKASQYDTFSQSYFTQGTANFITTETNIIYIINPTGVTSSFKICNYTTTTYISTTAALVANITPYTSSTTQDKLNGYSYDTQGNLVLDGGGPCGFTILPSDGTWNVNRITFKGQTSQTAVQLLGVFPTDKIYQETPSTIISMLANASAIAVFSSSTTYTTMNLNDGFDSNLGTYYTFSTIQKNEALIGCVQAPSVTVADTRSYYSVISFGALSGNLTPIQTLTDITSQIDNIAIIPIENLAGSPIPYPYAYSTIRSGVFYDGLSSINTRDMVIAGVQISSSPALLPPDSFYDKSVLAYEQSIPAINSHLHFLNGKDSLLTNPHAMVPWMKYPVLPMNIVATIPGFLLLQGTMYSIVSYNRASTDFTTVTNLTDDLIFPPSENTVLLSMTGNNTVYAFLGYSTRTNSLRIKVYNPVTNILTNLPYGITPGSYDPTVNRIGDFIFSNTESWWITYTTVTTSSVYIYGFTDTGVETRYGPRITSRGFLTMDPSTTNVYYAYTSGTATGFSSISQFNTMIGPLITDPNTVLIGYNFTTFTQMAAYDAIVYLVDEIQHSFFVWDTSTANVYQTNQNLPFVPYTISAGPVRSIWLSASTSPYIMGHAFDINSLDLAWQIFFPTIKVDLQKVTPMYTSMTDLTNIQTPEWQHSAMFVYSTFNSFSNDILANGGKWGLESNYMVCDTKFSGYDYNSYIQNIPVVPNWRQTTSGLTSNDPNAYYLAVRGFSPTEDFSGILRWKVPNMNDYGYLPISTLMTEISSFATPTYPPPYNISYVNALSNFNPKFIGINVYGLSVASGLPGSTIHTYGFTDFLEKFSTVFNTYNTYQSYLSSVNTTVIDSMNKYTTSNLKYILPLESAGRTRYTDPVPFSLQWSTLTSASPINYSLSVSEWGLGWNLGYNKADTPYATLHFADSLFKIQDEYIYLRLNPEFNINRLATGSKENYTDSREPSGITDQYYCKLLLNGFGNKATTFTHSPVVFNPYLPRLAKMNFEWLDSRGNILSNTSALNAEWSMTIHIQEEIKTFNFETVTPPPTMSMSTLRPMSESEGESFEQQEFDFASTINARQYPNIIA